ncbi:MAG: DNA mismatch repair protein MutT [Flavobacteriales bacterium]|nr:DNA mismatch repair protein MutT [Flavobacteriales bacterium]|tara:strand:- start:219 stop:767 length:549 start_codon:yes stop_codon:yes gene_type:complete
MIDNPWTKVSSKEIYDNPWIKLTEHKVLNPAGNDGIYGVIHFKNLAIGIIPLDKDGYSYLVGQYRFPLEEYSWEIPEGGGKHGIAPLESAQRELKEETGIVAHKWTEIQRIHTSNSVSDELGIIYLAEDLELQEAEPDEDEVLEVKRVHWKEMLEMVMNGEITDSLSVAGILKLVMIKGNDQ